MEFPTIAELDRRAEAAGLSRAEIWERLGIGRSTYYRWLNDEAEPRRSQLQAFVELVEEAIRE